MSASAPEIVQNTWMFVECRYAGELGRAREKLPRGSAMDPAWRRVAFPEQSPVLLARRGTMAGLIERTREL